ncbi:Pyridoxal-dependent decarboxylase domain-containing protein 1 [Phlyctochytrium planicorne]|nr:Pyridoxal-dependent decarboxylase domain-containing protein 1 [Phlyctochytrium planicorne]
MAGADEPGLQLHTIAELEEMSLSADPTAIPSKSPSIPLPDSIVPNVQYEANKMGLKTIETVVLPNVAVDESIPYSPASVQAESQTIADAVNPGLQEERTPLVFSSSQIGLEPLDAEQLTAKLNRLVNNLEEILFLPFWLSKFVHIHGRSDFSGGLLPPEDIQVFRTVVFVASLNGRLQDSTPVFYFPRDELASNLIKKLSRFWSVIGGPVNVKVAEFRLVPLVKEAMDTTALLNMMDEDISCGRRPCLLFCRAGTPRSGQVDELLPSLIDSARLADSVTVDIRQTFGAREDVLSAVTFFQNVDPRQADPILSFSLEGSENETPNSASEETFRITPLEYTLPLWTALQYDLNRLKVFYARAMELAQAWTSKALGSPALSTLSESDKVYFVSCIRFNPAANQDPSEESYHWSTDFISKCNIGTRYLFNTLPADVRGALKLDVVEIDSYLYIRYLPLRSDVEFESQAELLISALSYFQTQSLSCESVFKLQPVLKNAVLNGPKELRYIESVEFAGGDAKPSERKSGCDQVFVGLGAVQYTPAFIDLNSANLSDEVVKDLDELNTSLAVKLAEVHGESLFYTAQVCKDEAAKEDVPASAGDVQIKPSFCIGIGVDKTAFTPERIAEILDHIMAAGREMETGGEFVDNISAVVRKGIEKAERELKSEMSDEVLVFRSLPVIGTVLSIIGVPPLQKTSSKPRPHGPVARTFTISSGFSTIPLSSPQPGRMSISLTRENLHNEFQNLERRASEGQLPGNADAVTNDAALVQSPIE